MKSTGGSARRSIFWFLGDLGIGGFLVAVQIVTFGLMRATSSAVSGDPFDSQWFWNSWLIYPVLAGLAAVARPAGNRPLWWTAALIVPFVVEVAVLGTVLHDPAEGASLWLLGEIFVLVLGGVTYAGACVGRTVAAHWLNNAG